MLDWNDIKFVREELKVAIFRDVTHGQEIWVTYSTANQLIDDVESVSDLDIHSYIWSTFTSKQKQM